ADTWTLFAQQLRAATDDAVTAPHSKRSRLNSASKSEFHRLAFRSPVDSSALPSFTAGIDEEDNESFPPQAAREFLHTYGKSPQADATAQGRRNPATSL